MRFISPLRYPGGKGKLGPFFARLLASQSTVISAYAEPYAGGAGAGLYLLSEGYISRLLVNDLNPGIAAFWRAVCEDAERFASRVAEIAVNIDSWHQQRDIYLSPDGRADLDLGFATFFLNRCNRSGILSARPIGGLDQSGRWKIDARFNRADLISRIEHISSLAGGIEVSQTHALDFLARIRRRRTPTLIYADPPYLVPGEELYLSAHSWQDHQKLSTALCSMRHPWVLTYDTDDRVRELYPQNRCLSYSIKHTAQSQKIGREYMLFSRGLNVCDQVVVSGRSGTWMEPIVPLTPERLVGEQQQFNYDNASESGERCG